MCDGTKKISDKERARLEKAAKAMKKELEKLRERRR